MHTTSIAIVDFEYHIKHGFVKGCSSSIELYTCVTTRVCSYFSLLV